ncbi:MAG: hypothetical protein ACIAQU_04310 [Phycisphaerales bacterium JB064]
MFIDYIFGYRSCEMHKQMQAALSSKFRVVRIMVPRNHGKSQQVSIGRVAYEIGQNTDNRIGIIQASKVDAMDTSGAIRQLLESDRYRQIFPNVKKTRDWGKESLTVERSRVGDKNPTIKSLPWNGNAGFRTDILLGDDMESFRNSILEPATRPQVIEAWNNIWLPTLEPGGREWTCCTPWHVDGQGWTWRKQAEEAPDQILFFFRKCDGTASSPWPEKFSPEHLKLERAKMGPLGYARAYLMEPGSGTDTLFAEEWLDRSGYLNPNDATGGVRWMTTDKAYNEKDAGMKGRGEKRGEGDPCAYLVADVTSHGQVFCVEAAEYRGGFEAHINRLVDTCKRLKVKHADLEANGPQKELARQEARALEAVGVTCHFLYRADKMDKYTRAASVQPVAEQGRFHLFGQPGAWPTGMGKMHRQLTEFPYAGHDDLVDVAVDMMAKVRDYEPRASEIETIVASDGAKALDIFRASHIERELDLQIARQNGGDEWDDWERQIRDGYDPSRVDRW